MRPSRRGASPASTGPTPVEHPQATAKKSRGTFYGTPNGRRNPASASRFLCAALLWAATVLTIFGVLVIAVHPEWTVLAWGGAFLLVTCERVTS